MCRCNNLNSFVHNLNFNLEDEVDFNGDGNVIIPIEKASQQGHVDTWVV